MDNKQAFILNDIGLAIYDVTSKGVYSTNVIKNIVINQGNCSLYEYFEDQICKPLPVPINNSCIFNYVTSNYYMNDFIS